MCDLARISPQLFQHPARVRSNRMKSLQLLADIITAGGASTYLLLHAAGPDAANKAVADKPPVCLQTAVTIGVLRFHVYPVLF